MKYTLLHARVTAGLWMLWHHCIPHNVLLKRRSRLRQPYLVESGCVLHRLEGYWGYQASVGMQFVVKQQHRRISKPQRMHVDEAL